MLCNDKLNIDNGHGTFCTPSYIGTRKILIRPHLYLLGGVFAIIRHDGLDRNQNIVLKPKIHHFTQNGT